MIRLLYSSQAASQITDSQVEDILKSSRRNNPGLGITGVLIHGGGMFFQVLEGPETAVLRQYVKILDDRRHGDCQIIYISPTNERKFPTWSMAVIDSEPLALEHLHALRAKRSETVPPQLFTDIIRDFMKRLNAAK
jgi:hypothetical protein